MFLYKLSTFSELFHIKMITKVYLVGVGAVLYYKPAALPVGNQQHQNTTGQTD